MAINKTSVNFDGSNDYINVTDNSTLDFGTGSFTYEARIYYTGTSDGWIIGKDTDSASRAYIYVQTAGTVHFVVRNSDGTQNTTASGTSNISGGWHHIAGTFDGTAKTLRIYVDGVQEGTTTNTNLANLDNNRDLAIGRYGGESASTYFKGNIDDVRVWKGVVRTQAEIQANANLELVGTESNLSMYLKLNDATGTTANDETSNNNDGTLTGGPNWSVQVPFVDNTGPNTASMRFDSTDDYIQTPSSSTLQIGTGSMTYECWFKTKNTTTTKYFISWDFAAVGMSINMNAAGNIIQQTDGGSSMTTVGTYNDGYWHHLAFTRSSTERNIYVDGILDITSSGESINMTADRFKIGSAWSIVQSFDGQFDEPKLWKGVVRTQQQIRENARKELTGSEANLSLYYNFDTVTETSTVNDQTANNNDGTISGAVYSNSVPFTVGADQDVSGLFFDGSGDYVSITDSASLSLTSSITLECWAKASTGAGSSGYISKDQSSNREWSLVNNGIGGTFQSIVRTSGGNSEATSTQLLVAERWYHLAATWTSGSGTKLYIDGILEATGTTVTGTINSTAADVWIAGVQSANYFKGTMNDIRIWNVERTQTQLIDKAHEKLSGSESGLVGYWKADDVSSATLTDSTANANTGTFGGNATYNVGITTAEVFSPTTTAFDDRNLLLSAEAIGFSDRQVLLNAEHRIEGTVIDSSSNPVATCRIDVIEQTGNTVIATTTTDGSGNYSVVVPAAYANTLVTVVAYKTASGLDGGAHPDVNA